MRTALPDGSTPPHPTLSPNGGEGNMMQKIDALFNEVTAIMDHFIMSWLNAES
jgi:hypothetical protein